MESEYITLQIFPEITMANPLIQLLKDHDIEFVFEDVSPKYSIVTPSGLIQKEFNLNIKKEDFEKAEDLLNTINDINFKQIDDYSFLNDFSNEELLEIITKPDEWNRKDYILAQKLLKNRGSELNPEFVQMLKNQRVSELTKKEPSQKIWIFAGYIIALFGGILSIFIGWNLYSSKKKLPDGSITYSYTEPNRKNGAIILVIGTLSFCIWMIILFVRIFND